MIQKSEYRAVSVLILSDQSNSLRDSLATEPFDAVSDGNSLTCSISASTTIDLRARWNTMMRSLIGSEEALMSGLQFGKDE